ncbi:hypothetical protein KC318_g1410 [Hortaea werneckii]|uniref:Uncharacterized protein n=1 Tax=Hortaea werneckii TaxID=91943 RepID=A0A3M6YZC3_HORWE|nr:hypothetical protein KC334_g1229 [Hortaea werneckii]KAI7023888.1 hypothetical protein KC355_g1576 [Hortaea werneckii]KAI7200519.1 hypothetical protein KC324_g2673 [Hortaea werneckii]KAI7591818.1 hypothetical protein KC316_g2656 [Hortaea werneckii]KAI7674715.1 hypothetical protein KC318_g1410 [Hortaea werneckii]
MSSKNLLRFYYNEYQKALALYKENHREEADEACCELINDFRCPRLLQIQAYQLRSICTGDYWMSKAQLTRALELIASLNDDSDEHLGKAKAHTEYMMSHLESRWVAKWQELGLPAPKEQDMADTVVEAESEDESEDEDSQDEHIVQDDSDLLEAQRKGLEGMTIAPKEHDQGGAVISAAKKDVPLPPTPPRTSPPFRPASVDDDDDKMDEGDL